LDLPAFADTAATQVSPAAIVARVRSTGLDPASLPAKTGATYVMRAVDQKGTMFRVVLAADSGSLLSIRPAAKHARSKSDRADGNASNVRSDVSRTAQADARRTTTTPVSSLACTLPLSPSFGGVTMLIQPETWSSVGPTPNLSVAYPVP
jgi:hypothetical protein